MDPIQQILVPYVVLLFAMVCHEAAHALVAKWGGDPTAYLGGQVTLNPMPHIRREPLGTVILPLVMLVTSGGRMCFGFAHAPVDALWLHRNPKKGALMAAAGPAANLILAGLALLLCYVLAQNGHINLGTFGGLSPASDMGWEYAAFLFLRWTLLLNLLLALFNLIPWPPLDGATVLEGFFPGLRGPFHMIRSQPVFALIGALLLANFLVIPHLFWPLYYGALDLIR